MRTILCMLMLSFSIQADEPSKPKVPKDAEVKSSAAWLIDADTTAIVDVQIRSIFDFLPIKKRLNKKLRDELKQSTLLRQFAFDPLTDIASAQFALSETKDSTALVTGEFKRERRRTPLLIEGANDSYAQFLNDSTLVVATTKTKLEDLVKRDFKPLKLEADKQPLLAAIPAKPTGSVIWVASRWPDFLKHDGSVKNLGIENITPAMLKAGPIFLMTVDIEKTEVVFRWSVPSANGDELENWKRYLDKWADLYKTFVPLVGENLPKLKLFFEDSLKSITVKLEDKNAAVLSMKVSIKAADEALDVFFPGDDK